MLYISRAASFMEVWHNFQPILALNHNDNFSSTQNTIPDNWGWTDVLFHQKNAF
jgi:hypothetical protein